MITDRQVALFRQRRMEGKTQETAVAMSGMSVRSARKWERGQLPSATKQELWWRTRPDPFDGLWEEEMEPLLRDDPRATTIIEWLADRHPGRFGATQLRTLQRRLQDWRTLHGPGQEVYFPQEHPPGREAQIDFTHGNSLGVTISGQPHPHLLFQLILSHSGWRYAEVAAGETFLALQQGLEVLEQEAEDRRHRRINRLRKESRLPSGKTWETLEHHRMPLALRQHLDNWPKGASWNGASTSGLSACPVPARPMPCAPWGTGWWSQAGRCSLCQPTDWCGNCWPPNGTWHCHVNYGSWTTSTSCSWTTWATCPKEPRSRKSSQTLRSRGVGNRR